MTIQTRRWKAWKKQQNELTAEIKQQQAANALLHAELTAKIERLQAETALQQKENARQIGALGNRFGELAEHLVAPSIHEKFNALGYHFDVISQDKLIKYPDGRYAEVDILLENEEFSIAVEVKAKPLDKDVDEHIHRLEFLRAHKDKLHDTRKLRGAIAGAIMTESVRNYTLKAGFYVIEQTGDTVKINNPTGFVPREW
jgi:hypothetical protein